MPNTMNDGEGETEGKSALVPKSIFPSDPKVGDTITLTVSAVFGDEIEVSASEETSETEESPEMSADEELEALAGEEME